MVIMAITVIMVIMFIMVVVSNAMNVYWFTTFDIVVFSNTSLSKGQINTCTERSRSAFTYSAQFYWTGPANTS
jgi:hypothetical protein